MSFFISFFPLNLSVQKYNFFLNWQQFFDYFSLTLEIFKKRSIAPN